MSAIEVCRGEGRREAVAIVGRKCVLVKGWVFGHCMTNSITNNFVTFTVIQLQVC